MRYLPRMAPLSPDPSGGDPMAPPSGHGGPEPAAAPWRARLHEIIYQANTPAGRAFDLALILLILASVLTVMLESIASVRDRHGDILRAIEWGLTGAFTIEYILRVVSVRRPLSYMLSFFGLVDLMAVLPTYLSLVLPGSQSFLVVRFLRILRIFRVFKLAAYMVEAQMLRDALIASRRRILVFFMGVLSLVLILAAMMYLIEGHTTGGFSSIPRSVYWTIVTLTTVGYGDVTPQTPLGQVLASVIMLLGYSIIAVPTGIVTAELTRAQGGRAPERACPSCGRGGHEGDAGYCRYCGAALRV